MKIEKVSIDKLLLDPANARKHGKKNLDSIKGSLAKFGQQKPIVVNADNVIVAGNGTLQAAKELGWKEINIVRTDLKGSDITAFGIADNRTSELAEWDDDVLKELLEGLKAEDFDLSAIGFDDDEFAELTGGKNKEGLTDPDDVPEPPKVPITRLGDIYQLGNHRLMCGDSTSMDDVSRLMIGVYPDLIHTDPPYGMNAVSKSSVLKANYGTDIMGDDNPDVAKDAFNLIYSLYPNAKQIWWGANYYCSVLPDSECWIVWDKNNGQSDQTDCELAWANFRSVVRQFTQASEKINRVHPTQKPVSLMEWIIKRFNLSSKTIADYFGGSGSTLIAAEKNGLQAFIMEFDPKFCDVIVKRWEDFTGQKAVLINAG